MMKYSGLDGVTGDSIGQAAGQIGRQADPSQLIADYRVVRARIKVLALFSLAVAGLTGCAGSSGRIYAGVPVVTAGSCPEFGGVGHGRKSVLTIRRGEVVMTPGDGVLELHGTSDAAGHVTAGQVSAGADHRPFNLVFDGQLTGASVSGVFASPRCRASITLRGV